MHSGGRPAQDKPTWGPRVLATLPKVTQILQQPLPRAQDPHLTISTAARAITKPGRGVDKYKESKAFKQLRHAAKAQHQDLTMETR